MDGDGILAARQGLEGGSTSSSLDVQLVGTGSMEGQALDRYTLMASRESMRAAVVRADREALKHAGSRTVSCSRLKQDHNYLK